MSWTSATPGVTTTQPLRLMPLRVGDLDLRSFSWILPEDDTLDAIDNIAVKRRDNATTGALDLIIATSPGPPDFDATTGQVRFWLVSDITLLSQGSIDYQLTVFARTTLGRQLYRDLYIAVVAPLGLPATDVATARQRGFDVTTARAGTTGAMVRNGEVIPARHRI